jgi:hypothetical protein
MKTLKKSVVLLCTLAASLFINSCKQPQVVQFNPDEFQNPPVSSSIHTWWHWLDNAITKEGITRDLEAMKKQGIATATILNVGLFGEVDLGVPQVKFGTDEWYQMFEWALKEANRLGMTLGAHNCDGWSSSGGPWIDPANSMKQCIWSKSFLTGGKKVDLKLPEPRGNLNFFRDIRVIAFPVKYGASSFQIAQPEIIVNNTLTGNLLYDANPFSTAEIQNGAIIDISFDKEFPASKIAVHPRIAFLWGSLSDIHYQIDLKTSSDGKTFKNVQQFEGPVLNKTSIIAIEPVSARYYRLEFKNITGTGSIGIAEIELLNKNEQPAYQTVIPYHLEKTVTTLANNISNLRVPGVDASDAVSIKDIIDVTQFMNQDGILTWDAPGGEWEILRIGYTTTGSQNGPATKAGTGLECDKMDTAALNLHFRNFPAKLISHAGTYAGNTFEYLFIDSWECGYQNWTDKFASEFEKRRGYSIINWLPVMCGVTVDNPEATERFLHDFQQTIADLIQENYYKHFSQLCKQSGIKSHAEVIYGGTGYPPLDILKSNSYVDVPMFEFWATPDQSTSFINYKPVANPVFEMPAYAGALYGKNVIPAEAYTGYANYSESPWDLKLFGDNAFCAGINQMVLHSYVHQPFEKKPGITLGIFGQSFNRHNPWWDFASQWFTYHARVQNILQQGVPVADILYFIGDRFYDNSETTDNYKIPDGFRIQKCNLDILMNHCRVKNGKLLLDNGMSYEILLLSNDSCMNMETLKRIAELVNAGAVITGPKPVKIPGNLNYEGNMKSLNELAAKMWGNAGTNNVFVNTYGKGKVYSGKNLKEILDEQHVVPDFSRPSNEESKLIYLHKKAVNTDVYFVVNQEDKIVESECIFRIVGKIPEIWNPQYGTIGLANDYKQSDGNTVVRHQFLPRESLFFVFREETPGDLPNYQDLQQKYVLENFRGTIAFEGIPDKAPVEIKSFSSLTSFSDPEIKYYSGKVKYTLNFNLPADLINHKPLFISLEEVKSGYEITLNGRLLGCSTFPGYRFDVASLAKEEGNILEIRVAVPYRNRIIGDFTQYGSLKSVWTTSPVGNLPGKDKPLLESGILGPITFYY